MNILWIMLKDTRAAGAVAGAAVLLYGVLAFLAHVIGPNVTVFVALVLSGVYIIGALLATERYEEKNNGYVNLLRMPVAPAELAAGKLLLLYLMNAAGCGLVVLFVHLFGSDERLVRIFQSIVLMAGCIWLVSLTVLYSGICILGFTKFIITFRVGTLVFLVALQAVGVFAFKIGKDLPAVIERIGEAIAGMPWFLLCALVSVGYFAFALVAGRLVRLHATR